VSGHRLRNEPQFNSDSLEQYYGPQRALWPTDPYLFLVWWHCGYPASDASCAKGWDALSRGIGVKPQAILATETTVLTRVLKTGGLVPEIRAERLKELADRVIDEFGGDLASALKELPIAKARAVLKSFPGIADPGADRILLFGRIALIAAVPSSSPQVLVRICDGPPSDNYNRNYKRAQAIMADSVPANFEALTRAYTLLKVHGRAVVQAFKPTVPPLPSRPVMCFPWHESIGRSKMDHWKRSSPVRGDWL
jgi:endonuclease III